MKEKKNHMVDRKVTDVKVNQVEQEDMFLIVNKDGKYRISLLQYYVSRKEFDSKEEAIKYLKTKPWEVIMNVASAIMMINLEHQTQMATQNEKGDSTK